MSSKPKDAPPDADEKPRTEPKPVAKKTAPAAPARPAWLPPPEK